MSIENKKFNEASHSKGEGGNQEEGFLVEETAIDLENKITAWDGLRNCLSNGDIDNAQKILDLKVNGAPVLEKEEIKAAALNGLKVNLLFSDIDRAQKILDWGMDRGLILEREEIKAAALNGLRNCLRDGNIDNAQKILDWKVEGLILEREEIKTAVLDGLFICLSDGNIDNAQKILDWKGEGVPSLEKEEIKTAVLDSLKVNLYHGYIDSVQEILNWKGEGAPSLEKEEIKTAVLVGLFICLSNGNIDRAQKILDWKGEGAPSLEKEEIKTAVLDSLKTNLSFGDIDRAQEILDWKGEGVPSLEKEEIKTAVLDSLPNCLSNGNIDNAQKILDFQVKGELVLKVEDIKKEFIKLISETEEKLSAHFPTLLFLYQVLTKKREKMKVERVKYFKRAFEIFGEHLTGETFLVCQDILKGELKSERLRNLGISKMKEQGIKELKDKLSEFQKDLFQADSSVLIEKIKNNEVFSSYFKKLVSYEESVWGHHNQENFDQVLANYLAYKRSKQSVPLNSKYTSSKEFSISSLEKQRESKLKEEMLKQYQNTRKKLIVVAEIVEESPMVETSPEKVLSQIIDEANKQVATLIQNLKKDIEKCKDERTKKNLNEQIAALQTLLKRESASSSPLEEAVQWLKELPRITSKKGVEYRPLKESAFQLITAYFLLNNKEERLNNINKIKSLSDNPDFDSYNRLMEILSNNLKKEILKPLLEGTDRTTFNVKTLRRALENILSTTGYSEMNKTAQDEKINFNLIPTRNILTEFSGYIADVCWANKYNSILKEFPNLTSVNIVENYGEESREKLSGAFLLLETRDEKDQPLLVIRGLNPLENFINHVKVEEFYQAVITWVKEQAAKMSSKEAIVKAAIVIDDHSGGSATNRPALYNFLAEERNNLSRIDVPKLSGENYFNGYDISKQVYLV
jgi:ribosomal protein L18